MFLLGPGVVYILLLLALLAAAIVIHVSSTSLSLPISPGTTLATLLLLVLSAVNALLHPRLLHNARGSPVLLQRLYPSALQTLQAVLTTALTTLLLQQAIPGGSVLPCHLGATWQRLFADKDERALRRIQDTFDCCGFNKVKDRAWPFPQGQDGGNAGRCAEMFGRDTPCAGPWAQEAGRTAGMELGVVLALAVLQITTLLIARPASSWRRSWWARGWRPAAPEEANLIEDRDRITPLLDPPELQDDSDEPVAYSDLSPSRITQLQYGTTSAREGNGPRVEPSTLPQSPWRD